MIQSEYYEVDSSGDTIPSGNDSCNNTPFSVKDILNLVDQGDSYMNCQMERLVLFFMQKKINKKYFLGNWF